MTRKGIRFGTDGVRGVANTELTGEMAYALGRAGAHILAQNNQGKGVNILVGKDTRISCDMLEAALVAGICSVGATAHTLGVLPTPAVATMVRKHNMDAGIMISASHNEVNDNGIKFFNNQGYKLDDAIEAKIEDLINAKKESLPRPTGANIGSIKQIKNGLEEYAQILLSTMDGISLKGLKIGIDCANGATHQVAGQVITALGAMLYQIHNKPNGININENCGSTHMDSLVALVKEKSLDIGIAFDGDGDRCLVVDANGNILDGDEIMSICAHALKKEGKLAKNTVVATIMSNIGLKKMADDNNIDIINTNVGDRYVLEAMLAGGYNFGGEQSGHFIFLDHSTTGDGTLTALQLLKIMATTNKPLHELNTLMTKYPQVLVNATVPNELKATLLQNSTVATAIQKVEQTIGSTGRVLIRPSGTEPLVRVMIEGEDKAQLTKLANELKDLIEKEV